MYNSHEEMRQWVQQNKATVIDRVEKELEYFDINYSFYELIHKYTFSVFSLLYFGAIFIGSQDLIFLVFSVIAAGIGWVLDNDKGELEFTRIISVESAIENIFFKKYDRHSDHNKSIVGVFLFSLLCVSIAFFIIPIIVLIIATTLKNAMSLNIVSPIFVYIASVFVIRYCVNIKSFGIPGIFSVNIYRSTDEDFQIINIYRIGGNLLMNIPGQGFNHALQLIFLIGTMGFGLMVLGGAKQFHDVIFLFATNLMAVCLAAVLTVVTMKFMIGRRYGHIARKVENLYAQRYS